MVTIHERSARNETAIAHLVSLKTQVLNFLNGEPGFSYPEFYKMYATACIYLAENEPEAPGIRQSIARLPVLIKPTLFYIDMPKVIRGCSNGTLAAYLYALGLFAAAPVSLPLMLFNQYQERKIRTQLNKLYNTLERILWKLVTE